AQPAAAAQEVWTNEGGGGGHGVGLSQYGAYGKALEGRSATQILTYYYKGTSVSSASQLLGSDHWIFRPEALWVGLSQADTSVRISAVGAPATVCHKAGNSTVDETFTISPAQNWMS